MIEPYEVFMALDPVLLEDWTGDKERINISVNKKALKDLMHTYERYRILIHGT